MAHLAPLAPALSIPAVASDGARNPAAAVAAGMSFSTPSPYIPASSQAQFGNLHLQSFPGPVHSAMPAIGAHPQLGALVAPMPPARRRSFTPAKAKARASWKSDGSSSSARRSGRTSSSDAISSKYTHWYNVVGAVGVVHVQCIHVCVWHVCICMRMCLYVYGCLCLFLYYVALCCQPPQSSQPSLPSQPSTVHC